MSNVPVPWIKDQDDSKIEKKLFAFLKDSAWQAEISGDINEAHQLMNDFKESDLTRKTRKLYTRTSIRLLIRLR